MREILGAAVWGADEETLPHVVLRLLAARGETLAVVENAAAGGAITAQLSLEPISDVWRGSEVWAGAGDAVAQAHTARLRTGASIGLGIAVDVEGHGTVAIIDAAGEDVTRFKLPQALPAVRARAATTAFAVLRRRYV